MNNGCFSGELYIVARGVKFQLTTSYVRTTKGWIHSAYKHFNPGGISKQSDRRAQPLQQKAEILSDCHSVSRTVYVLVTGPR